MLKLMANVIDKTSNQALNVKRFTAIIRELKIMCLCSVLALSYDDQAGILVQKRVLMRLPSLWARLL